MSKPLRSRYDFVLLFDVKNGNPNGDPDAGNAPRIDPETGFGLVSDVCIKRKVRDFVSLAERDSDGNPSPGYDIFVKSATNLNIRIAQAHEATGGMPPWDDKAKRWVATVEKVGKAAAWMCQKFFDVRCFGAVMSTGPNAGQVRGPVQISFSQSVDIVVSFEQTITRVAVADNSIKGKKIGSADFIKWQAEQPEDTLRTMARKEIVPYGLYRCHGFVSPHLAAQTGFDESDLTIFWKALKNMFEHDHSAARGEMASQKLFVFEHESDDPEKLSLGRAPAHRLFERIGIKRRDDSKPPRQFEDYEVTVAGRNDLPAGVTLHEML